MASGIIRVFRSDFAGAISAFDRVLENSNTRTPLKIDALLYRGMAKERLAQSGREDFEAAYKFSPFSQATVRYLIMADIAALADKPGPAEAIDDFREKAFERWRVRYRDRVFEADVPRRRFESTSLVLRKEIVDSAASWSKPT